MILKAINCEKNTKKTSFDYKKIYTIDQVKKIKELENLSLKQGTSDLKTIMKKLYAANRLSSTIGGNREMDQHDVEVSNIAKKPKFSHIS